MVVRDVVAALEARHASAVEQTLVVHAERPRAPEPCREDEGQTRSLPPRLGEVEDVREPALDLQRRVPDDERALAIADGRDRLPRPAAHEPRLPSLPPPAQDETGQDDAGARREIHRELVELVDGPLSDEDHAADRASRADRGAAHDAQIADAGCRCHGHQGDVGLVLGHTARDLGGRRAVEHDAGARRLPVEPFVERFRVEVTDRGDPEALVHETTSR